MLPDGLANFQAVAILPRAYSQRWRDGGRCLPDCPTRPVTSRFWHREW